MGVDLYEDFTKDLCRFATGLDMNKGKKVILKGYRIMVS
jgi:hypothetical protein